MAEEEGEDKGCDVASVHIGIGHDNHFMVAEFAQVKGLAVLLSSAPLYPLALNPMCFALVGTDQLPSGPFLACAVPGC